MLNSMVLLDLVTYRGGTIVILFLQATIKFYNSWKFFNNSKNKDKSLRKMQQ